MTKYKFKKGDKVIYQGLIGVIESCDKYAISKKPCYSLTAEEDEELSCTASEEECKLYVNQKIDQTDALAIADIESTRIRNTVEHLTDKYYSDFK